ncbi:MAG TPA: hypothetical protein VN812_04970 [Candidatus Acidoferrales bacterium]|nr:hypothetical protein [Candidatus Acidoferrales bacterium]
MVVGAPVIVGGAEVVTVIVNGARDADAVPSLTEIVMLAYVPTLAAGGVPDSWPVAVLNVAQAGWFSIANRCVLTRPDTVGVKAYADPACTEVGGVPLIFSEYLVDAEAESGEPSVATNIASKRGANADRNARKDAWTAKRRGDQTFM